MIRLRDVLLNKLIRVVECELVFAIGLLSFTLPKRMANSLVKKFQKNMKHGYVHSLLSMTMKVTTN
jgi:hypothetical protein